MKRFLILLLPLVAIFALAGCHDDKDLPDVSISFTFDNPSTDNGVVYVVQGQTLNLKGITIKSRSGKAAGISAFPRFFFDGYPAPLTNIVYESPYAFDMTMDFPVSDKPYALTMYANVFEVDKSIAQAVCVVPVMIVASEEDIPEDAKNDYVPSEPEITGPTDTPVRR